MSDTLYMVFDVESIGLHGEGFAVGWVIINQYGIEINHGLCACHPKLASGSQNNRKWVEENIQPISSLIQCNSTRDVRSCFWSQWVGWKTRGAILVADCCWPVEARFLAACVEDEPSEREWEGPYPLHDLASVIMAKGNDPLAKRERKANEIPEHNPLADARQSARLLIEALK